jgi:hypothetical protein
MHDYRKASLAHERFIREARELLLGDAEAVCHALVCEPCGLQAQAHACLLLVDWTEDEFFSRAIARGWEEANGAH